MPTVLDVLEKAIDHSKSIASISPQAEEPLPEPSSELNKTVDYKQGSIPEAIGGSGNQHMGFLKHEGNGYVVRHGAPAHRADVAYSIAKLMGADHMMPRQVVDSSVHAEKVKRNREDRLHNGTMYQEWVPGEEIYAGSNEGKHHDALRRQWKSGELHRLWGAHYIANDTDNHGGNFKINDDGVKYFDSDHAFYDLPYGHVLQRDRNGNLKAQYMGGGFEDEAPTYVKPFVKRDPQIDSDGDEVGDSEDIEPIHKNDKADLAAINAHAAMINPELFKQFGPHAHERALKVQEALSSGDPTGAMLKLWQNKENEDGDSTDSGPGITKAGDEKGKGPAKAR